MHPQWAFAITGDLGGTHLTDLEFRAQQWVQSLGRSWDAAALLAIALFAAGLLTYRLVGKDRPRRADSGEQATQVGAGGARNRGHGDDR